MDTETPEAEREAPEQELSEKLAEARQRRRPGQHPDPERRISEPETPEVETVEEGSAGVALKRAAADELAAEDQEEQEAALGYLLRAFHDDDVQEVTKTLRVNVGSSTRPKTILWKIRSIPGPTIRALREQAEEVVRRQRGVQTGKGATDAAFQANVRVVIEGSIDPDIRAGARQVQLADPADFLETALNRKQLLIDQIAGEILTLSGGDEEDVQDAREIEAAGNSSG